MDELLCDCFFGSSNSASVERMTPVRKQQPILRSLWNSISRITVITDCSYTRGFEAIRSDVKPNQAFSKIQPLTWEGIHFRQPIFQSLFHPLRSRTITTRIPVTFLGESFNRVRCLELGGIAVYRTCEAYPMGIGCLRRMRYSVFVLEFQSDYRLHGNPNSPRLCHLDFRRNTFIGGEIAAEGAWTPTATTRVRVRRRE